MNKILLIICFSLFPYQSAFSSSDIAEELCRYTASNDKNMLQKTLRSNGMKLRHVYYAVKCNGKSLLEFASDHDALKAGTYIITRLPKSILMDDIATLSNNETLESVAIRRIRNHW